MKVTVESIGDHSVGEGDFVATVDFGDSLQDTMIPRLGVLASERVTAREVLRAMFAAIWPVEWHTIDVIFEDECPDCRMIQGLHRKDCPSNPDNWPKDTAGGE